MSVEQLIALVTGANQGLGLETARQLGRLGMRVVLTSRDGTTGKAAADKLQSEGLQVLYQPLDVTRPESAQRVVEHVRTSFGRLDVLINNAGIFPEGAPERPAPGSVAEVELATVKACMETNLYGPLRLIQLALPLMRQRAYGRIVNVSSGLAQLSQMRSGFTGYRLSKTALNALTRIAAAELQSENILVNAVNPGWMRTRMGGSQAPRSVPEAAAGVVWAATLPANGPSGGLFMDRQPLAW